MWFKIDDRWRSHRKTRRAARREPLSLSLWAVAGDACAEGFTEGVIEPDLLDDCAHDANLNTEQVESATTALVESGLWHDSRTIRKCDRCLKHRQRLPRGSYVFHDWFDYQFTKDEAKLPEERMKKVRAKRLSRDHELRVAVVERDRGCCRYCTVRVDFRDRVSDTGGTYDHVDPAGPNTLENVVVACRGCNVKKGNRTPGEAGMFLLAEPDPDLAAGQLPASPGPPAGKPGSVPTRDAHATLDGPGQGQVGASPRLATGQVEHVTNGNGRGSSTNGEG